jgi:hypothetical protein
VSLNAAEHPANHRQVDHCKEVPCELLVASGQSASLLKPPNAPLDHITSTIGLTVKVAATTLVDSSRNDRAYAMFSKPPPDPWVAVTLVGAQPSGSASRWCSTSGNADLVESHLKPAAFVVLPRTDQRR